MSNTLVLNTSKMSEIKIPSMKYQKQAIRDKAIAKVKSYLSTAKTADELHEKKQFLCSILKCYQNAVNNEGQYEYFLKNGLSANINDEKHIQEFFDISKSQLEILCCHQNSFFADRKLNFFGEACYTNSIQSIIDEINSSQFSKSVAPTNRAFEGPTTAVASTDLRSDAAQPKLEKTVASTDSSTNAELKLEKMNIRELLVEYDKSSSSIKALDTGKNYHYTKMQQIEGILSTKEVNSFLTDGSLGGIGIPTSTDDLTRMLNLVNKFIENCSNAILKNTMLEVRTKIYGSLGELYEESIKSDDLKSFLPAIENYRMAGNAAKVEYLELRAIACDKELRPDVYANLAKFEETLKERFNAIKGKFENEFDNSALGIIEKSILDFYFNDLKIEGEYNIYHESFELADLNGGLGRLLFAKLVCGQLKFKDDIGFDFLADLLILEFVTCKTSIDKYRGDRFDIIKKLATIIEPETNNNNSRKLIIFGKWLNTILSFADKQYGLYESVMVSIDSINSNSTPKESFFLKGINTYPTDLDTANEAIISKPYMFVATQRYTQAQSDLPKLLTLYFDMLLDLSEEKQSQEHVQELFTLILKKINELIPTHKYDESSSQWQEIFSKPKYMGLIVSNNVLFSMLSCGYLASETNQAKKTEFYSQVIKAFSAAAEIETDPAKKVGFYSQAAKAYSAAVEIETEPAKKAEFYSQAAKASSAAAEIETNPAMKVGFYSQAAKASSAAVEIETDSAKKAEFYSQGAEAYTAAVEIETDSAEKARLFGLAKESYCNAGLEYSVLAKRSKEAEFYSQAAKAYSAAAEINADQSAGIVSLKLLAKENYFNAGSQYLIIAKTQVNPNEKYKFISLAENSFENAIKTISNQTERINAYKEYIGLFEAAGFISLLKNLPTSYASELLLAQKFTEFDDYLGKNSNKNEKLKLNYASIIIESDANKDGYYKIAIGWFFKRGMFDLALQGADFISNQQEKELYKKTIEIYKRSIEIYKRSIEIYKKIGSASQGMDAADKIKNNLVSLMNSAIANDLSELDALNDLQDDQITLTGQQYNEILTNLLSASHIRSPAVGEI